MYDTKCRCLFYMNCEWSFFVDGGNWTHSSSPCRFCRHLGADLWLMPASYRDCWLLYHLPLPVVCCSPPTRLLDCLVTFQSVTFTLYSTIFLKSPCLTFISYVLHTSPFICVFPLPRPNRKLYHSLQNRKCFCPLCTQLSVQRLPGNLQPWPIHQVLGHTACSRSCLGDPAIQVDGDCLALAVLRSNCRSRMLLQTVGLGSDVHWITRRTANFTNTSAVKWTWASWAFSALHKNFQIIIIIIWSPYKELQSTRQPFGP